MTNTIRTPKLGKSATSRRIAEAVDNEDWQSFRLRMKGMSTQEKLEMLKGYYDEGLYHLAAGGKCKWSRCEIEVDSYEWENYKIRIDNYIKALCRGGQLNPGESLSTALSNNWKLTIRK